ncbi:CTD nuclear envelope phosphatase 1 -like protein, partial [Brachionus plicatilis]
IYFKVIFIFCVMTIASFLMSLQYIILLLTKIWTFLTMLFKKKIRTVIQHQAITYVMCPLSPSSQYRLSMVQKKILVLDLDETLIHSHHDGLVRPAVKPGTPPDFILRVEIDRHPVRFYVYKRPHVDYFLSVVNQWFELVVFTASMEIYGAAVADKLDNRRGMLRRRYYRQV